MGSQEISRRSALFAAVAIGAGAAVSRTALGKKPKPADPPAQTGDKSTGDKSKNAPTEVEGLAEHLTHEQAHAKTQNVKLAEEHHHHHVMQGKNIHITPADLSHITDPKELAQGQMVALIDTELAGDETGLPPGKYHIVTAKVGKEWHAYAVADQKIVARLKRVGWKAQKAPTGKKGKDGKVARVQFEEKGWGWWSWWPWSSWGAHVISNDGGSLVGRGATNIVSHDGGSFIGWGGYA